MVTPAKVLRFHIHYFIWRNRRGAVSLQSIYDFVDSCCSWDAEDLVPETRSKPTSPYSWKRNVRNVLTRDVPKGILNRPRDGEYIWNEQQGKPPMWSFITAEAMDNLNGEARFSQLYEEIERLAMRDFTDRWKMTVQGTIERHSSDSENFENYDVFYSVQGIGQGFWGLREIYRLSTKSTIRVEDDFDMESSEMTDKVFIVDDDGIPLDSDFRAYRQGSHVVVHILSLGGSGASRRGTGMRQGRVIAARRIRESNLLLSAILTANAGQRIRNSNPPIVPTQMDCVVRKGKYLHISDDEDEWCTELWREAAPIASTGAHNFDRPLLFFFETELSPSNVLDVILHRRISFEPNSVPPSPKGREAYSIDAETIQGGWVYIIRNHSWPGWLKVGKAADLNTRMRGYRTCEPHDGATFEYIEAYPSEFALNIEQATHDYLSDKLERDENNSTRRGEWYWISKDEAISAIKHNWIGEFPESD
uniref:Bacteriophage T5 Orf172 DNA-binding domain-containing protein n=1 Tax=uncultured marine group II/III euryarchaeote AD1000_68_A10 TaxID=1457799 RepID=A0A075G150_9EURY|nr:hypothetical protein [uncultured marine group II/III euryarchaeote AD1000_68_A10]